MTCASQHPHRDGVACVHRHGHVGSCAQPVGDGGKAQHRWWDAAAKARQGTHDRQEARHAA